MTNDNTRSRASRRHVPPMPEGFTDRSAWDAIHYEFSPTGGFMDAAVIDWQANNQDRVKAAIKAKENS